MADTNAAIGEYGPFILEGQANTPGPGGYNCWAGATCSTYGNAANWCVDTNPADSVLECDLPFPSGTTSFYFTVSNGTFWWGDQSCDAMGGAGQYNGTLTLSTSAGALAYVKNGTSNLANDGNPADCDTPLEQTCAAPTDCDGEYYNGYVALVP